MEINKYIDLYMVFVGGVIDAENVSKEDAEFIAWEWKQDGYDDVVIQKMAKKIEVTKNI